MGIHLLVIGERPDKGRLVDDEYIDEVAAVVTQEPETPESTFLVRRCSHPNELIALVRRAVVDASARVDTLDLFDHGSPGRQRMGTDILFDSKRRNLAIARELRPFLSDRAKVRLLGCETAWGVKGRDMLLDLQDALDRHLSVVVHGTIAPVTAAEFDKGGFSEKYFDEIYLVPSTEVHRDRVRSIDERSSGQRAWRRTVRTPLLDNAPNPDSKV